MLDQINFDRAYIDLTFDAHGDVVGIIGNPNGEGIGVFENAVYHQLGLDFDAANFTEVGFDHFFPFIGNGQAVYFVVDVHIHGKLFAYGGVGVIEVSEVVNGRGDVLGVLGDGEFALFVAEFFIVVVVYGHVLIVIGILPHCFGISQRGL